jgi:preprotein translocase subunit SecF
LHKALIDQIPDLETRFLTDANGKQNQIIILTAQKPEVVTPILENYLGYTLNSANSSIEFTGSSLSENFYKQLAITILIGFFWMAAVVFVIFAKNWKIKSLVILLNFFFGIFLGKMFFNFELFISLAILLAFIIVLVSIYIKYSIPSFAVMLCAFADIVMTLAIVDFLGMKIAGAGIVAFLMLIGYSVDTDILLTTRVMTRKTNSVNSEIFGAFKTGMTMSLAAIVAIAAAWFVVRPFGTVLNQMFEILLIGLFLDIFNTWVTNTSLIKWFVEHNSTAQHETHL